MKPRALTLLLSLGLSISLPVARAYNYDDLVRLTQAEQRVFGRVDMNQSIDDRVRNIEVSIFGSQQSGSDSSRVRRICGRVGIPYPEPEPAVAPIEKPQVETNPHLRPSPWGETQAERKKRNAEEKSKREADERAKRDEKAKKEKAKQDKAKQEQAKKLQQGAQDLSLTPTQSPNKQGNLAPIYKGNPQTESTPLIDPNTQGATSTATSSDSASNSSASTSTTDTSAFQTSETTSTTTEQSTNNSSSDGTNSRGTATAIDANSTTSITSDPNATASGSGTSSSSSTGYTPPSLTPPSLTPPPSSAGANTSDAVSIAAMVFGTIFAAFLMGGGLVFLILKPRIRKRAAAFSEQNAQPELPARNYHAKESIDGKTQGNELVYKVLSNKPLLISAGLISLIGVGVSAYFLIPSADNEFRAAKSAFEKKDYDNAMLHIDKALQFDPRRNDLHVMKGRILTETGRGEDAVNELNKVLGSEPLNTEALFFRAEGFRAIQDYRRAMDDYAELLKRKEHVLDCYLWLGRLNDTVHNYDKAIEYSNKALETDPNNAMALWNIGKAYKGKEEFAKAIEFLNRALTSDPKLSVKADRGYCFYKLGKYKQAQSDLEKAVDENVSDLDSRNYLALCYDAVGKHKDAVSTIVIAADRDSQNSNYKNTLELSAKHLEEECRQQTLVQPNNAQAHADLAFALYNLKNFSESLNSAKTAISLRSDKAEYYYIAGNCQYEAKNFESAIQNFTRALELNPNFNDCKFELARAYSAAGETSKAIRVYTHLIALNQYRAGSYRNRAQLYYRLYKFPEAISDCQNSLQIKPDDAITWRRLADCYENTNQIDKSMDCLKTALRLQPQDVYSYSGLADLQLAKGDVEGALQSIDLFRQNRPDYKNFEIYFSNLAKIYCFQGNYDKALESNKQATKLEPTLDNYVLDGLMNIAADKPAEAKTWCDKALKAADSEPTSFLDLLLVFSMKYLHYDDKITADFAKAVERKLKSENWPAPAIHLYAGSISMEDFVAKNENNPDSDQTEFHSYAGLLDYVSGRTEAARKHFDWVKANGVKGYLELIPVYGLMRKNHWM